MLHVCDFILVTALGVAPLSRHAVVRGITNAILANCIIFSHPGPSVQLLIML